MSAPLSLRGLFAIVALVAIATAVLLRPTFLVASAVWSMTLFILGGALLAAFCSTGRSRAFWTGFAFFGCMHLILATAPWFDDITANSS
jgi:hypothetical protein